MTPRPSHYALTLLGGLILLGFLALLHGVATNDANRLRQIRENLVHPLGLSDIALFTEARYTRHPAMADRHAPFQDHPASLDHFPTGSLITPPSHISNPGRQKEDAQP